MNATFDRARRVALIGRTAQDLLVGSAGPEVASVQPLSMVSTPAVPAILAVLAELRAQNDRIIALLSPKHDRRRLSNTDEKLLRQLLTAIVASIGNRDFYVRDLINHAELHIPTAVALREALTSIGGALKIGRILRRGLGADSGNFQVIAIGSMREGVLWRVEGGELSPRKAAKTRVA